VLGMSRLESGIVMAVSGMAMTIRNNGCGCIWMAMTIRTRVVAIRTTVVAIWLYLDDAMATSGWLCLYGQRLYLAIRTMAMAIRTVAMAIRTVAMATTIRITSTATSGWLWLYLDNGYGYTDL
jgi:hypothetical protein